MKKILTLLMVFVLVLSGCSAATDTKKITVWAMGMEGEKLGEFSKKYTETSGITVEVVAIPWDQANEKITTAIASGQVPDALQIGNSWIAQFASTGAFADLANFQQANFSKENFFTGAASLMEFDGKMVTVPWYVDSRVLFYRKDVVKTSCGSANAPKDWTELYECALKLSKRGDNLFGIDLEIKDQALLSQFAWANGFEYKTNGDKSDFTDPKMLETVEYFNKFFETGAAKANTGLDSIASFTDEKATLPMFISGPWMVKPIDEALKGDKSKWGVAPIPAGKAGSFSVMGGTNLAIMEKAKNKEEAAKYINWLVDEKTQVDWYNTIGALPAVKSAWSDEKLQTTENKVFEEALKTAKTTPNTVEWEGYVQELIKAMDRILVGKEDINKVFTELQAKTFGAK